jgi:hypothetical protein
MVFKESTLDGDDEDDDLDDNPTVPRTACNLVNYTLFVRALVPYSSIISRNALRFLF